MEILHSPLHFFIFITLLSTVAELSRSADIITLSQPVRDNETLVSAGGKFKLGFFSTGNSSNRYVGIWFYNIPVQTIVWVANRDDPINGSSGVLQIETGGNLVIVDGAGRAIWSTNTTNLASDNVTARLLDSGNLVLTNESNNGSGNFLWQSFDHPFDTLLAGMKLGWDRRIGLNRYLTSWRDSDDPSTGDITYKVELQGLPQKFLRSNTLVIERSGPWDGIQFSGLPLNPNAIIKPEFVTTAEEVYYTYQLNKDSTITRAVLNHSGTLQRWVWDNNTQWAVVHELPNDSCDVYAKCGPNAVCTIGDAPICSCLTGYTPKLPQEWAMYVWSSGCVKKKPLNCPKGEGFKKLKGVKVPDMLSYYVNRSISLDECRTKCLKSCTCTAYTNADIVGKGSGCLLWYGDLLDIRKLIQSSRNQNVFIRVMASDLGNHKWKLWLVVAAVAASLSLAILLLLCFWRRRTKKCLGKTSEVQSGSEDNLELPLLDLEDITKATSSFSSLNKIGEGGFGPVYKGLMSDGVQIAVKRLSRNSRQGCDEFKNEVLLIARLQHRNLVKLLGCCITGEERMLVYEYMPNGSLDSLIFANRAGNSLVWRRRFNIIVGVARGLLYLHRDSRLRIIHRDLKASNVLLDSEMNPKISDFGMARAFRGDQLPDKTKRVVGTYGYMSPEYAIDGIFSTKSDVFSFGVLVLEIISGRRNREFHHHDHNFNLLGHAWKLWLQGEATELIDKQMEDSFPRSEAIRCIQIGLLCVQQRPEQRPTMSSVLRMLDSESASLPQPKQPGFYTERFNDKIDGETSELTFTTLDGR
ncbi:G-type lectin S-receptor-like serine/threonine-protein kinase At4g27290 [Eucalyptus grandis]|uniref:G-type lectin S-receptor-like serine/threonine-protein kinase At4g27290 n=1 Tax=Eucalyptus grandis TaxID=71139 RepID=UPI00192ECB49|nr:G-type lectin S-receptor-like serine/threonine-protein kinase At4g27290 [Eucalyptus grandis]